jgi:NAD-dependent dihydropyrimidine dehydrogenase PreA subunit
MIELLVAERCSACNICVEVCPTNVFERQPEGPPAIARQSDCQTCYMCEVYCPDDALYVAPLADRSQPVRLEDLPAGQLGSYRRAIGWTSPTREARQVDDSFILLAALKP